MHAWKVTKYLAVAIAVVFAVAVSREYLIPQIAHAASTYYPPGYITPATQTCTPANPTAPSSTSSFAMQGLACLITTATPSGKILVSFQGTLTDSATTVGNGIIIKLYCGSGSAPANAGAIPGNLVLTGTQVEWATGVTLTTAADLFQPINATAVAVGLTPGTQYWCDVAAESVITASNVAITNITMTLAEVG